MIGDFQKLTQKELPGINAGLKKKKAEAISVLTEADWQKKRDAEGSSGAGGGHAVRTGRVQDKKWTNLRLPPFPLSVRTIGVSPLAGEAPIVFDATFPSFPEWRPGH